MGLQLARSDHVCQDWDLSKEKLRDIIKKASDIALRCSFWLWLKRKGHCWSNTERRKESLVKGINSKNPCNQQSRIHRKSQNNRLEIQKKQSKTEIWKNTC